MISAEFLQMDGLINECISYILCNLADVVRLPIDMDCISDGLAERLARRTPVRLLIGLYDKRDKLRSRLLGIKTQHLASVRAGNADDEAASSLFDYIWLDELSEEIIHNRVSDGSIDVFRPDPKVAPPMDGDEFLGHCSLCKFLHL